VVVAEVFGIVVEAGVEAAGVEADVEIVMPPA
jgi:hypothetical protein